MRYALRVGAAAAVVAAMIWAATLRVAYQPQLAKEFEAAAETAQAEGNYAAAVREYRRMLELYPNEPAIRAPIYLAMSVASEKSGDADHAAEFAATANALDPTLESRVAGAGAGDPSTRGAADKLRTALAIMQTAVATAGAISAVIPQRPPQPGYAPPGAPIGYALPPAPAPNAAQPGYPPPGAPTGYAPPPAQPGYPPPFPDPNAPQAGYQPPPGQPGYPPQAAQPGGYQPAPNQAGFQPPPGQPGYPPQPAQPGGYQPAPNQTGYQPPPGQPGYPPQPAQPGGYQPAPNQAGYQPPPGQPGYPPQPAQSGGYQPAPNQAGYQPPPGQPGYPPQPAQPGGYQPPPTQPGYPPQPAQQGGYQPQPNQAGYQPPPALPGYPPQSPQSTQTGGYFPAPNQTGYQPPPGQPGYPQQPGQPNPQQQAQVGYPQQQAQPGRTSMAQSGAYSARLNDRPPGARTRGEGSAPVIVIHDHFRLGEPNYFEHNCSAILSVEGGELRFIPSAAGEDARAIPAGEITEIRLNLVVGREIGAFHISTKKGLYLQLALESGSRDDARTAVESLNRQLGLGQ